MIILFREIIWIHSLIVYGRDVYEIKLRIITYSIILAAAHAGYVDYRHEYYDDGRNYDRVYMSHRFATGFGVAVEVISRSDDSHRMMRGTIWKVTATSIQQAINLLRRGLPQPGYCNRDWR